MNKSPATGTSWTENLSRSGYFVGAVLIHLVIFVLVATWVVFPAVHAPPDDRPNAYLVPAAPALPIPPPVPPVTPHVDVTGTAPASHSLGTITVDGASQMNLPPLPRIDLGGQAIDPGFRKGTAIQPNPRGLSLERREKILELLRRSSRTPEDIADSDSNPRNIKARFPVYLATYANGDWNCNVHLTDGKIDSGSLPDLVAKIGEWSHGRIDAEMVPQPLNIAGPDLLDKQPPFIFFTGHKDFVLTDAEVQNLRNYLEIGGAIWGDNALAGRDSRFDRAFRREMKRVVPDRDKDFQPVAADDEMLSAWFRMDQLPSGMNFYAQPLEHLDIDGRLAILYTPNDYSDLFFMRILPGDTQVGPDRPDPKTQDPLFTSGLFWRNKQIFFRNFELPSCLSAQHLGMNVIGFMLTRFDKDLQLATP